MKTKNTIAAISAVAMVGSVILVFASGVATSIHKFDDDKTKYNKLKKIFNISAGVALTSVIVFGISASEADTEKK